MKSCLNLSKLRPKYCRFLFLPDTVYKVYIMIHRINIYKMIKIN